MARKGAEIFKHVSNQMLLEAVKKRDWSAARTIVYEDAAYAHIKDHQGFLPLHLTVKFGGPPELTIKLLTANPDAVRLRDPDGNYPLHLSAYHHKGRLWINISEVATTLYAAFPDAIKELDAAGNLPLHIAIRYRAPDELIRFLVQNYPKSSEIEDGFGNLPLHLSIQFESNPEVVRFLMNNYPNALKIGNRRGSLPLHKAAQFEASMDVLRMILDADGSAASVKDNRGNVPLHLLFLFCAGPPAEERLSLLLRSYPGAVGMGNNAGCIPFGMMNRPQDDYR
mmetsp:Transcript_10615/g.17306  ORF Transcript_10615/g.17306 Transcript_10615/m.17306 type:complete len:282 (+) Transcript_10615:131-976(+)